MDYGDEDDAKDNDAKGLVAHGVTADTSEPGLFTLRDKDKNTVTLNSVGIPASELYGGVNKRLSIFNGFADDTTNAGTEA